MLFDDTYLTIATPGEGIFKDKGSKFLAFVFPVKSEEEIKQHLNILRKSHPGANHHCYAFRLGADKSAFRANDDGEPAGTAGRPILGQIQSKDLTNVLIVVVRYFGGTLLGVSGLINAYKSAAAEALANTEIISKTVDEVYELTFQYEVMNDIMKVLKDEKADILEQQFDLCCRIVFSVRKVQADKLNALLKKNESVKVKYFQTI